MDKSETARILDLQNKVIRYLYEHCATRPNFTADYEEVQNAVGISAHDLRDVRSMMMNFKRDGGNISSIGLSDRGQEYAESIGPITSLMPDRQGGVTINANYSVVQVAGAGSSQSASLTIDQSRIETVLNEIEAAIPSLDLDETKRAEASGLLSALRGGLIAKIGDAGLRAIGGALGSILVAAGSPLGQSLMQALNIILR